MSWKVHCFIQQYLLFALNEALCQFLSKFDIYPISIWRNFFQFEFVRNFVYSIFYYLTSTGLYEQNFLCYRSHIGSSLKVPGLTHCGGHSGPRCGNRKIHQKNQAGFSWGLICPNLSKQWKFVSDDICIQIRIANIFQSDFVICIGIRLFKIARNHPKRYHLCQKPAKRCFGNCLLVAPSDGYLCIHNRSDCDWNKSTQDEDVCLSGAGQSLV